MTEPLAAVLAGLALGAIGSAVAFTFGYYVLPWLFGDDWWWDE